MTERNLDRDGLQEMPDAFGHRGNRVIGPTVRDQAVVYDHIASVDDLPEGWTDREDGWRYRLVGRGDGAFYRVARPVRDDDMVDQPGREARRSCQSRITIVTDHVRAKKRRTREVFVRLAHPPGHAQVDFGETLALLPLVPYLDTLRWIFIAAAPAGIAVAIYARWEDWKRGTR